MKCQQIWLVCNENDEKELNSVPNQCKMLLEQSWSSVLSVTIPNFVSSCLLCGLSALTHQGFPVATKFRDVSSSHNKTTAFRVNICHSQVIANLVLSLEWMWRCPWSASMWNSAKADEWLQIDGAQRVWVTPGIVEPMTLTLAFCVSGGDGSTHCRALIDLVSFLVARRLSTGPVVAQQMWPTTGPVLDQLWPSTGLPQLAQYRAGNVPVCCWNWTRSVPHLGQY